MQVVAHRPTETGVRLWVQAELAESGFVLEVHDLDDADEPGARPCWSQRTGSRCDDHGPRPTAADARPVRASHWCPGGRDPDHLLPNVVPWSSDTRVWWEDLSGLVPGHHHVVRFRVAHDRRGGAPGRTVARFRTLPETLYGDRPLRLLLASCYCEDRDDEDDPTTMLGRLANRARLHRVWRPLLTPVRRLRHLRTALGSLRRRGPVADDPRAPRGRVAQAFLRATASSGPPDISLLVGDQVYLDAPISDFVRPMGESRTKRHISRTYSRTYSRSWEKLGPLLSSTGNFFLTDDHEYWNNYPANPLFWPALVSGRSGRRWELHARQFMQAVQAPVALHTFDVGSPREVAFCLADTRMHRQRPDRPWAETDRFMREADLEALLAWIARLDVPGVLAIGQPLVADPAGWKAFADRGLPDYGEQYRRLCQALAEAPHDVLVLTGDIHLARYTKIELCPLPEQQRSLATVHELVTSPLTLLPGAGNSFRFSKKPERFPGGPLPGLGTVEYHDPLPGTTDENRGLHWWSRWRRDVCRDHFMVLEFSVDDPGTVHVTGRTHLIRPADSHTAAPSDGFPLPDITLR